MKLFFSLLLSFMLTYAVAQPTLYLRTGNIKNVDAEKSPSTHPSLFSSNIFKGNYYLWLQFNQMPDDKILNDIKATGVSIYNYLPDNAFIASFPLNYNFNLLKNFSQYYAVLNPSSAYKIDASLFNKSQIPWATENDNIKVDISFTKALDKNTLITELKQQSIQFTTLFNVDEDVITAIASFDEILKIAQNPLIIYIEPIGPPARVEDINSLNNHRSNYYNTSDNWASGRKVNGNNVVIAVGDDGAIGPHIDFEGRLTNISSDFTASNTHADHVSGIVAGAGNLNPAVKGQAPGAKLLVYDGYAPYNLFPSIYNNDSVRIVTHSLGQGCFGPNYSSNARTNDMRMLTYPNLMYTHSSGNSGSDPATFCPTILGGGYRSITGGYKAAKNVTTVGNLDRFDVIDASSSRGPVSDGRIKPDLCGVGSNVNSTQPNNAFAVFSGTSMSCPGIAGSYALMMDAFRQKNNAQPEGALLKAIMLNSADDLGNEGPDYIYGWGRANIRRAIKTIDDVRYFSGSISTNGSNNHTISIPNNVYKVKVMVYWADKEATANAAKALVNNLDAKITGSDNTVYLPWSMDISTGIDAGTCANLAIKYPDSLNNVEQVQIDNPLAGNYTLNVFGRAVPSGPQKYFVVYELYSSQELNITYPNGGETLVPNEQTQIRWDAADGTGTFAVSYSINNGTSWVAISNSVAAERRFLNWTPPSTLASRQALIRITRGATTDISDTNFVILRVPTNITFSSPCSTGVRVSWSATNGATEYDVFRLGPKYMELVGTTTLTSDTIYGSDNGVEYYYAVRAKMSAKGGSGRLSNALAYTNNSSNPCPLPVKLISFNAFLRDGKVNLVWKTASEIGMLNYVIERSTNPNFENIYIVNETKPNNLTTEQTYLANDENLQNSKVFYYRLKMIEHGKTTYSNVQVIKLALENNSVVVSPIPAKDNISVTLNSVSPKNVVIKLFNELGAEVLQQTKTLNSFERISLNISNLANGNYFISIIDIKSGENLHNQKINIIK